VLAPVKRVSKTCQEAAVFDAVERAGAPCFRTCSADGQVHRNLTDGCWTHCFYDTVLGPDSNKTAYPSNSSGVGMTGAAIKDAWLAGFGSTDPARGGCPPV